jgi:predicted AAA+ superfamily ATPase
VAQHLRAFCQLRRQGASLSFWRTRSGLELDFVVYGTDLFWAIEVRRSARIDRRDLAGLKAFGTDYPQTECLLLSLAPEPTLIDAAAGRATRAWHGEQVSSA